MICPYYKNKEVFDGFNELIEAFGGKPMTEEEFRSVELRNLRTGLDFAAMEAAYTLYDKNGGNFLDLTPQGKPSILFLTLLDLNKGDRLKAIILKSNVYSEAFEKWFGDWINDSNNASRVVDENGEPLVVYHGGAQNIKSFNLPNDKATISFDSIQNLKWAQKEGYVISNEDLVKYNNGEEIEVTKPVGIYFAAHEVVSRSYFGRRNAEDTGLYATFLNIRNPHVTNKKGKQMLDDAATVKDLQQAKDNSQDGVIIENVRDYGPNEEERMNLATNEFAMHPTTDYIVFNPNQIKSATGNKGTFSKEDNDIYNTIVTSDDIEDVEKRIIKGELGVNKELLIDLLGSNMYTANVLSVAEKELIQNAFDAVKIAMAEGKIKKGKINITFNEEDRTITVADNGSGMTADIVQKAFFTIGGSYKGDNVDNRLKSGGLGLAKMAFLFSSEYVELITVKNGKLVYVKATQNLIKTDDFNLNVTNTNKPNGTIVTVKIPKYYVDNDGVKKSIYFSTWGDGFLSNPMIGNVEVTKTIIDSYGEHPPKTWDMNKIPEGYVEIGTATSEFGDILIFKNFTKNSSQATVLISGLFQFKHFINNADWSSSYDTIINILPKVGTRSPLYPINNQREDFRATVSPEILDLDFFLNKIDVLFNKKKLKNKFGRSFTMDSKKLDPIYAKKDTSVDDLIKDTLAEVEDKYEKIVTRNPDTGKDFGLPLNTLREEREREEKKRYSSFDTSNIDIGESENMYVDTSNMDINKPVFYNNTDFKPSDKTVLFMLEFGAMLIQLRNSFMLLNHKNDNYKTLSEVLHKQYWGIALDKQYNGINVHPKFFPFIGINPMSIVDILLKEAEINDNTYDNSEYMIEELIYHTILHELTHNSKSGHDESFTVQFQYTYSEVAKLGEGLVKWRNTLRSLIKNNLKNLIEDGKRFKHAENIGDSLDGTTQRSYKEESEEDSIINDEQDTEESGNTENVSGLGDIFISSLNSVTTDRKLPQQFEVASLSQFGTDITTRLLNGEAVSSKEIIRWFIDTDSLSKYNLRLASILSKHDIPIVLDLNMKGIILASTITNKKTKKSVITLNRNLINKVTNGYLGESILHEIIHAVTVNAINNPTTEIESRFVELNKKLMDKMREYMGYHDDLRHDVDLGTYALYNEKEFAAVFITDDQVRKLFIQIARRIDKQLNGTFKSILKRFINAVSELFVNKGVFNTNEQQIKEYQKAFIDHLNNVKIEQNMNINSMLVQEQFDKMNNDVPVWQLLIDKMKFLSKTLDTYELNDIVRIKVSWKSKSNKGDDTHTMDDIVQKLNVRLNAIRTSNLSNAEKTKLTNDTKTQIDMFVNQQTTKYIAITMLLKNVVPLLLSDLRKLKNINLDEDGSITGEDYMYHLHSNFGMYNSIASTVLGILNQNVSIDQILREANRDVLNEEDKITRDDLESVKNSASTLLALTEEGKNILYILRDRTTKSILMNKAKEEDYTEDLEEYLENMTENPLDVDSINWFEQYLGAMDSSSSEALRLLSGIVNKSLKKADRIVLAKGVRLLELEAALKHGESGLDLYELDENGRTTGYLTRRLNFGRFYKNYDNFLVELNKTISKYTDGIIEDTARTAPNDDSLLNPSLIHELGLEIPKDGKMTIRLAWNKLKNKWLDEHCLRKYNSKYYDAWSNVPQVAKDALDSINSQIASLLQKPGVLGSDGYNHYELLTDEEWETLLRLWIDKKLLRSDYDMFGNLKEEGSTAYIIAKALQLLQEDLNMGSESNIKKDVDAWTKAMNRKIEECGGFDAYEKWKRKEKGHGFKAKEFKKWHQRNSRLVFKKDENGDEIIFKDIEDAMQGVVIDYGPEYDQLKELEKKLLKPYYSQSGEVNALEIPTAVANKLKDIYRRQFEIKQEVASSDPTIKAMKAKYGEVFSQFIELKDTSYFKQIKKQIKERATDENGQVDLSIYDALIEAYGRFKYDSISGFITGFKPHKWLQYMQAIDVEKYMEYQPGDAWTEKVDNEELLNNEYTKALEELNSDTEVECNDPSFIPKKSLYDNSKAFNKIKNSPTLYAFYNGVLETMHESNELLTNRLYADDFLLPLITGTLYKRMKRHSSMSKFKIIWLYLIEKFGIGYNPDDYSQIGSNQALDTTNDEGQIIVNNTPIRGRYPDGRTFHIMPQYYTRKLEDPSQISSSLVEIVMSYYKMSNYYNHKVAIKDDCETIVDFLKSRSKRGSVIQFSKNGVRKNEEELSSTGEAAEKFLEMNLYDIRRSNHIYNIGNIQWQWSKTVSLWKEWTTKQNLGCNPKVAITGFLTTMGAHIVNMITGQNYGKEGIFAFFDVLFRIVFMNLMGTRYIGNRLTRDVMMLCAEEFDISDQALRKWEASNRNRLLQAANKNSIFGFLSTTDFISKSIIMKSILKSHHLYNKEFISKADLLDMRYTFSSDKEFKKALEEWEKAPSLDKLLKEKKHKLSIDDEYKDAYEKSYHVIKNRILKTAEYADGMATPLQKAAISQSILGALVLIHKQYFPLILLHFYGKRVYDYDTHQYKNGVIRILFDYIALLMQNNLLLGIGAGIFTGQAFGGFIGAGIGAGIGVGTWLHARHKRKKTGERKKSLRQLNKEYFSDFKNRKSTKISYSNRRSIKEAASVMILHRILVLPLVAWVCSIADDDDDEKWWLQLLAFSLRGFEWEFYTAFRSDDMLNTFKSPTAATGVLDKFEGAARGITNTIAPQGNMLFNPSETWDDFSNIFSDDPKLVTKGAYKGMTPLEKSLIKLTPQHNLWEQYKDSKSKRTYLENQVMYIQKPEE